MAVDRLEALKANAEVTSALSRLLVVVENHPQLKADQTFARLMDELAGAENRIAVERMRYNEAIQAYNTGVRTFCFRPCGRARIGAPAPPGGGGCSPGG